MATHDSNYVPSAWEVVVAREILKHMKLPTELVLAILDYARYWPEVTAESIDDHVIRDEDWSLDFSASHLYLWEQYPFVKGGVVKVKEIEFTIVSHDQGWTTENTGGTYQTSSWFEAAIFRINEPGQHSFSSAFQGIDSEEWPNMELARRYFENRRKWDMVPRPSEEMEGNRVYCPEMMKVTWPEDMTGEDPNLDEGKHSWYLQGNMVAKGTSVFKGEMVKRYHVVWGSKHNPRFVGNEGAGKGEGFVDSLRPGDVIGIFANVKRRGWENHIYGVRMTIRYTI